MESSFSYAVSYLHGRDEAWVARFLDDLDRRLAAASPVRLTRWPANDAGGRGGTLLPAEPGRPGHMGRAGTASALGTSGAAVAARGLAEADRVLVLCSPAYFAEGPAEADWAVLAHRASLERALGRPGAGSVLPLLWEPITQRLPDVVAEADSFTAGQPPEYRSLGLALMTMQAARYRTALDQVLDNLTRRLATPPAGTRRVAAADLPDELPPAMAPDDARFTALYRREAVRSQADTDGQRTQDRRVRWHDGTANRGSTDLGVAGPGPADRDVAAGELPAAGRRLLLIGPAGSGRSDQLAALARQIAAPGRRPPWDCRVAFRVPAATGALPSPDGIVSVAAPALAAREPAGWAARRLRAGQALLAVEGLDHAPGHLRTAAWEWLLRMTDLFPRAAYVVETNGTSVPWHRVAAGAFTPVVLRPLSPEQRPRIPDLRTAISRTAGGGSDQGGPGGSGARTDAGGAAASSSDAHTSRLDAGGPVRPAGSGADAGGTGTGRTDSARLPDLAVNAPAVNAPADTGRSHPYHEAGGTGRADTGGPRTPADAGDPLLRDVAAWPVAAEAVRRVLDASAAHAPGLRVDVLTAAVAANWRSDAEAAASRTRVSGGVLRAAARALAAATLAAAPAVPVRTALEALDSLRAGGATGVPPDRLLSQLAGEAGLLYAPEPDSVMFTTEAVRCMLAAEHLASHPGPAAERLLATHAERTGTHELAVLVAELSRAVGARPVSAPNLLEFGVTSGRLTSRPLPATVPGTAPPVVVRTLDDLLRLAGGPDVPELRCQGPLSAGPAPGPQSRSATRLGAALAAVPGLRALVIADHPGLRTVPDLGRCTTLRSLRLVGCPALRDLTAVARSELMFLTVDPWRESLDLTPLRRARWLRRVELRAADAPPGAPARITRLGRAEVCHYAAPDPAADLSRT